MIAQPSLYKDYFTNLVATSSSWSTTNITINSFYFGISRRIIEAQRTLITYPVMWSSYPSYRLRDNGAQNFTSELRAKIWIITQRTQDDYKGIDQGMNDMFSLVNDLLRKMKDDASNSLGQWCFSTEGLTISPLEEVFTDYNFGYELNLFIPNAGFYNVCPLS